MRFFFPWGSPNAPTSGSTTFQQINTTGLTWVTTESSRDVVCASSFTLDKFYVAVDVAPGVGNSWTFTIRKNGANAALTVTISGTATSGVDSAHTVSFADADTIDIVCTSSGTPTAPTSVYGFAGGYAAANSFPIMGGTNNAMSASAQNWLPLQGGRGAWLTSVTTAQQIAPCGFTLKNLRVRLSAAPGTGKSHTLTLYKNGAATAVTVTVSDTATTGTDTTHSVSYAAGDTFSLSNTPSGTPATSFARWACECSPTNDGDFFLSMGSASTSSVTGTQFDAPIGVGNTWTSTESNRQLPMPAATWSAVYAKVGTAPGGTASRTLALRINGVTSALSTTITGSATTNNASATVTTVEGDLVDMAATATSSPVANTDGWHAGWLINASITVASSASDSMTSSDSVARVNTLPRTGTDSLAVTDSPTRGMSFPRTTSDSTTITDSVSRTLTTPRTASDSTTITDEVTRSLGLARTTSDALTVTDSPVRTLTLLRAASDSTGVSEAVTRALATARTTSDAVTVTDASGSASSTGRSASDSLAVTDSAVRQLLLARTATDSFGIADSVDRVMAFFRIADDSLTVTDDAEVLAPLVIVPPSPDVPFGKTITLYVRSVTGVDEYQNDILTETSVEVLGVAVWPLTTTEIVQARDQVVIGLAALIPPGVDLAGIDAVGIDGKRYEIDGEPARFNTSPFTGTTAGVQLHLKRVTG